MNGDTPLRPVRVVADGPHDLAGDLRRSGGEALGSAHVSADRVEDTFRAVGAVEAVAGHVAALRRGWLQKGFVHYMFSNVDVCKLRRNDARTSLPCIAGRQRGLVVTQSGPS